MADATRVHLDVELELGGDRIRGLVDDGAGPVVEFAGWLELMSAFDIVCARASAAPGGADPAAADVPFEARGGG